MALAAFFLLAALASGATDGGSTPDDFTGSPVTTCLSGNCENGIGIREDPKGTYEGAFENGRQNARICPNSSFGRSGAFGTGPAIKN